jgi:hypothetical protein
MPDLDELMRRATTLADKLQRRRAAVRPQHAPDIDELAAMESQLAQVWAAIRAARASGPDVDALRSRRRPRSKWE